MQYRATDAPWYPLGHGIVLAYISIGFIASLVYRIILARENSIRNTGARNEAIGEKVGEEGSSINGHYNTVEEAKMEKGDAWSGFRYSL